MSVRKNPYAAHSLSPAFKWKSAVNEKGFSAWLIITFLYLAMLVVFLNRFLPFINRRRGISLRDPLLAYLPPADLSIWIFSVIYLAMLMALLYLLSQPHLLLRTLIAAAIVYTVRIFTLYWVPLDPPSGCIPLADPFILHFAYGGILITKDLFFSGHTASMLLLVLAVDNRILKTFLAGALTAVMIMLLYQHAHYSIDIAGALIITPICWKVSHFPLRESQSGRTVFPLN
jgi:hypothetical protein